MVEENKDQESRLKNIDETRNYFVEEIKQNELMSKKHKKGCTVSNYIEHLPILASAVATISDKNYGKNCYSANFVFLTPSPS